MQGKVPNPIMQVAALFTRAVNAVRREIKLHPRIYSAFQIIFLGWSLFWLRFPPAPGKAVLLLAVVAAIVTIQPQMTDNHRLAWLVIVFVLFAVEFRALNRDRAEALERERNARAEENAKFATILEEGRKHFEATLAENQREFVETMQRSDRIIAGVGDSVRVQTGGDSFAYITFTAEPAYVKFGQFSNVSGPWFLVSITSHGKYPLREIRATLIDEERRTATLEEYKKHPAGDWIKAIESSDTHYQYQYLRPQSPEGPSGDVEILGSYPIPQGGSKRLSIAFSSLNGYWSETLHLGLANGTWRQCLSVIGPTVKQARKPFIYCDSDWPEGKALAEKDWPHVKPPSRHQ